MLRLFDIFDILVPVLIICFKFRKILEIVISNSICSVYIILTFFNAILNCKDNKGIVVN